MIGARLQAYRRQRHVIEMTNNIKSSLHSVFPWKRDSVKQDVEIKPLSTNTGDTEENTSTCSEDSINGTKSTFVTIIIHLFYFLLWAILYATAIKFQFGAVYFALSLLIFIWFNTRLRPRKKGELSAYSVFNPNCEAIEGTLDASQFEQEIRFGIGSIR